MLSAYESYEAPFWERFVRMHSAYESRLIMRLCVGNALRGCFPLMTTLLDFTRRARPQLSKSKVEESKFRRRGELCVYEANTHATFKGQGITNPKTTTVKLCILQGAQACYCKAVRCPGITSPQRTTVLHFTTTKNEKSQANQIEKSQATPGRSHKRPLYLYRTRKSWALA